MIHGGGLVNGGGDQHDGSLIVGTDHIVVVSVNYRLGVFGFLSVPGLTAPAYQDGNFGLLDQEAALRRVRRNISAFGGDPGDVTIAGESAGGYSVCALLASPPARGLFAKAIMESGSCVSQPLAAAQKSGLAFAAKAGCANPATAAACLRAKPESALLDASTSISGLVFTADGADLPVAPARAITSGRFTRVPVIIGTNHDEGRTFAQGFSSYTRQQYQQFVTANDGSLAPQMRPSLVSNEDSSDQGTPLLPALPAREEGEEGGQDPEPVAEASHQLPAACQDHGQSAAAVVTKDAGGAGDQRRCRAGELAAVPRGRRSPPHPARQGREPDLLAAVRDLAGPGPPPAGAVCRARLGGCGGPGRR